ncbi:MAG TPA: hypothetical protein PK095_09595 [Myxococcota bacterium]|nr:hypothetical protein [Myxococcota bacterium]
MPTHYGEAQSRRYDVDFTALFGGPDRGDLAFFRDEALRSDGAICEVGAALDPRSANPSGFI